MIEDSINKLRKIRKDQHTKIHIIDIIDGEIFDYEPIFPNKQIAKEDIAKDILELIQNTYDNFPGKINLDKGMIICVFYHKRRHDLIGTVALYHYIQENVKYIEVGLSLIAEKYRKMGFQSVEIRRMREFAFIFLRQGYPFYVSARMASAATQLQVSRSKQKKPKGNKVKVAYPKGFIPFYIANKDRKGNYLLEFGLFYEAWPTLDSVIKKDVFLPDLKKVKQFRILNPRFRKDLKPHYIKNDNIKKNFQTNSEKFEQELLKSIKLFGNLKPDKEINTSSNRTFEYSIISAPNSDNLAIMIEKIHDLSFLQDISSRFKSINVTLKFSDFQDEKEKCANVFIMKILIEFGFVPSCIHDLLYKNNRVRVILFSYWQNIKMQDYFEFLPQYYPNYKLFWHDCKIQGLEWTPEIEIMTSEKIEKHILIERFKSIL